MGKKLFDVLASDKRFSFVISNSVASSSGEHLVRVVDVAEMFNVEGGNLEAFAKDNSVIFRYNEGRIETVLVKAFVEAYAKSKGVPCGGCRKKVMLSARDLKTYEGYYDVELKKMFCLDCKGGKKHLMLREKKGFGKFEQ